MQQQVHREAAPLRMQVVNLLRAEIVAVQFEPGERLIERTLCERYGVSRTVIREALRQLESEGLVNIVPNRGPVVATLTAAEARGLYEVRAVLEALAGRDFANRATKAQRATLKERMKRLSAAYAAGDAYKIVAAKDEFDDALLDGAGNPAIRSTLLGIRARTSLLRRLLMFSAERNVVAERELKEITRAATSGDPEAAWAACESHVQTAAELALELLEQSNGSDHSDVRVSSA